MRTPDGASRCVLHKTGGLRPRPCLVCGKPVQGNYCSLHEPVIDEAMRNARNPYRKAYKDPQYARNRRHRFERAHGKCEMCGTVLQPAEWECDHAVPLRDGGTNDISNLLVLCKPCHRKKTAAERRNRK
jgi:5-methylcytosine-specific restriction protein A